MDAFGIVLWVVVVVGVIAAIATLRGRAGLYERIGRGGLSLDGDEQRPAPRAGSPIAVAERDEEIRQMLVARNDRRVRQGKPPLDVEAELARLTAPAVDPGLADEVRQLVIARNERFARQGKPQLDVEAETERRLRELGG